MILVGAYLRRNEYEDYDIKLPKQIFSPLRTKPETFNLYRLNAFFKNHQGINLNNVFFYQLRERKKVQFQFLDPNLRRHAISAFKSIHKERFHARIDWSAGAEIVAIILTFIGHITSIYLALGPVY